MSQILRVVPGMHSVRQSFHMYLREARPEGRARQFTKRVKTFRTKVTR